MPCPEPVLFPLLSSFFSLGLIALLCTKKKMGCRRGFSDDFLQNKPTVNYEPREKEKEAGASELRGGIEMENNLKGILVILK